MSWITFIKLVIEVLTKAPAVIETVERALELIQDAPIWERCIMRYQAAKAMKVAIRRASMVKPGAGPSRQESCATDLKALCDQWERKYGGRRDVL